MVALWLALGIYCLVVIALGWRWRQEAAEGDDFWTASRTLSAGSVGLSISAGFMSVSWSCVYAAQLFYGFGLGALWLMTVPWLLALGGIYWLAQRYHGLAAFSQPEMVGQRFGPAARRTLALPVAFVFLVWGGAEIFVAGELLAPGLGVPRWTVIVGISVVVGLYSILGGLRAVVATDKLQYVLVALYVLVVAWLAAVAMRETGSLWPAATVPAAKSGVSWLALASPGLPLILLTLAAYLPGWLFETDLWVRVQAARDVTAARRGMVIAAINAVLFVGLLPLFIGVAALVLFPAEGGATPAALGNEGDAIFAALVSRYAPPWLTALVGVGLVSAAMSTIDTCVNVMALSLGYDLFGLGKSARANRGSQLVTALSMTACCIFALCTESLWDIFYLSSGILSTSVAFPVAAVFWQEASARGVRWSSLAGFLGTAAAYFLEKAEILTRAQPEWLTATGLGYILWGALAATTAYHLGSKSNSPSV